MRIFFCSKIGLAVKSVHSLHKRSYPDPPFFHQADNVIYDIVFALGVQYLVFRYDVAVQDIAFSRQCPINILGILT